MSRYRTMNDLSRCDAAYIAGLIDGEGTITLSREHRNENRRLVVSIASTERCMLDFVAERTGCGKITNKCTTSDRHAPSFAYRLTNRQALDLLTQILPFLRSYKAARAVLAVERYLAVTPRNGKYSLEMKKARDHFEVLFLATRKGSGSQRYGLYSSAPARPTDVPSWPPVTKT